MLFIRPNSALTVAAAAALLIYSVAPVAADATVFVGVNSSPRAVVGVGIGRAPGPVGFEVEYAGAIGEPTASRASLSTVTVNLIIQPRPRRRLRPYGIVGFGAYGESRLDDRGSTDVVYAGGLGAKLRLRDRFSARFDYRLFLLRRPSSDLPPTRGSSHRASVGLNIEF